MKRLVKIYCLKDPEINEIKYIGKTWVKLSERLRLHIIGAERSRKPTRKEKWILDLKLKGLKPAIEILSEVNKDNWRQEETNWIAKAKELGWPILNLKRGGDGYDNLTHSEEFKSKLKERMKGNKFGVGNKWSEETRRIMKEKRIPWNKGKKGVQAHSEETKKKMSISQTGKIRKGIKWSEDAKSRWIIGHAKSWETRRLNQQKNNICVPL